MIIVSGQPRSGTSLMMKVLWVSGFPIFSSETVSFEHPLTPRLELYNDWVLDLDPNIAIKVVFPHVLHLPIKGKYKVIWMHRNSKEQAKSQANFSGRPKAWIPGQVKIIKKVEKVMPDGLIRMGCELIIVRFETLVRNPELLKSILEDFVERSLNFDPVINRNPNWSKNRPVGKLEFAPQGN